MTHPLEYYHDKKRIVQLIAAEGWWIVYWDNEEKVVFKEKIVAWALVEDGTGLKHLKIGEIDRDPIKPGEASTEIHPVCNQDGYMDVEDNSNNRLGFYHESSSWAEEKKKFAPEGADTAERKKNEEKKEKP